MKKGKRHTPEQIVKKLREAEAMRDRGMTVAEVARELQINEQTYYRWRKKYGGMEKAELARLKELEKENGQLKKLVADLALDKSILEEALKGKYSIFASVLVSLRNLLDFASVSVLNRRGKHEIQCIACTSAYCGIDAACRL